MRYTPAVLALAALVAVTASAGRGAPPEPLDRRAADLMATGAGQIAANDINGAVDSYEAALTIQPGHAAIFLALADATRRQGLQGKALHYYRQVLQRDPDNADAIAGEGVAFAEKGALDRARRNLSRVQQLCGGNCPAAQQLSAAIQKGPAPQLVTAAQIKAQPVATQE